MRSKASILPTKLRVRLLSSKESSHLEKNECLMEKGEKSRTDGSTGGPYTWSRYVCESKTNPWETQTRWSLSIALVDAQLHFLVLVAKNDDHP